MYFHTDNLTVGYNGKPFIENINIGIEKGNILCLLGPNGCGKSTILKSITKHLNKIAGTVYIGREDLNCFNSKEMAKKISVVFTDRIAPEMMTCEEVVATGRYPYTNYFGSLTEQDNKIIEDSMSRVSALEFRNQEFTTLSDGQKQRVLLARALCQQPEIIVLDEPTSYLDIRHKIELLGLLRKMAIEQNITVILSLHEVDLATKLADVIILVKDNEIFRCGFPEDILNDDIIRELYDIQDGNFNMLLGSVELPMINTITNVFVLGGDGYGTLCYRALHKKGISFYTGILHHNDIDCYVAQSLAKQTIAEKSFHPISSEVYEQAKQLLLQCEVVIDSGFTLVEGNKENALLLKQAQASGKTIVSLRKQLVKEKDGIVYFKDIHSLVNDSLLKNTSKNHN